MTITDEEFETTSWHDCHIWGMDIRAGNPDDNDWTSDLAFDVDYITAWNCGSDASFMVAPATLVFHGVTDPRMEIDWGRSGFQAAVHPISIDRIERERIIDQKVFLDRPYFRWAIRLNWPEQGLITFGAVGFRQELAAAPVLTAIQHLTLRERQRLIHGAR